VTSIRVRVSLDRMGCLTLTPSERIQRQIVRLFESMGSIQPDGTAFIQQDTEVDSFIDEYVPARKRRDLREGWDVTITMDPWTFGHFVGYDFHEAIKP
jgi:hypothetical protein